MYPKCLLVTLALACLAATPVPAQAKKKPTTPAPAAAGKPPLRAWSGVWHTAATVEYSSCPGTEPGHQEAFTLTVAAEEKKILATETPEQSLTRKLIGSAELRGKLWVLELRDKSGKNGMDLWLEDDGRKLTGRRVLIRQASRKATCSVVYSVEGSRDEA